MIDLLAVCVACTAGVPTQQSGIPSGDSLLDFPPRGLDITALNSRLCNDTLPRNQSKKLDGKQKTFVVLKILAICELEPLNRITSLRYVSSSLTRQFDCFHWVQHVLSIFCLFSVIYLSHDTPEQLHYSHFHSFKPAFRLYAMCWCVLK